MKVSMLNSPPGSFDVAVWALCLLSPFCAPSWGCRSSTPSQEHGAPSRTPAERQDTNVPTASQAARKAEPTEETRPSSYVCPKWSKLGPRTEFFLTPDIKRFEPNFGNKPPFSIRLPAPTAVAPWWISKGMTPLCERDTSACLGERKHLFEHAQQVEICGDHPRLAPIRVATIGTNIKFTSPGEAIDLEKISPYCLLQAGHLDADGGFPDQLSQHDFSEKLSTCVAQASDLKSWVEGEPNLHYLSVMRFKVHDRGPVQQIAVVFVVDEQDWHVLKDLLMASAKSFQVNWSRFEDRIMAPEYDPRYQE